MDYQTLGLKSGIEIHQQLEGEKLFCNCPAVIIDAIPEITIKRELYAAAGETGKVDIAAKHEQRKQKYYVYNLYKKNTCLVEIDEEPPHPVNKKALETALIVSKLLHANIVDEIQFMRKTVVDGSNVGGFQRTGLIATEGYIETTFGRVGVQTVCLEEDSGKIVEKHAEYAVYNLSRLGIPLIEIATDPDMKTPEQVQEVAEKIGLLLRSTGNVKRGLGTIRQDLNVSIAGGTRVEIKGAQDLRMLPTIVKNEVFRQQNLLLLKHKLKKFKKFDLKHKVYVDVGDLFNNTECTFLSKALKNKNRIYAMKVPGFSGLLGLELMPDFRVGTEVSDKTKVLTGAGIVHSDELPKFGISEVEVKNIRKKLSCREEDAFLISAIKEEMKDIVFETIVESINLTANGVLSEVRAATTEGVSTYLRPMPTGDRMYPETDIPTIQVTEDYLNTLRLPESLDEKLKRLKSYGITNDLAELIVRKGDVEFVEKSIRQFKNLKPSFIAEVSLPKKLEANRQDPKVNADNITNEKLTEMFNEMNEGNISLGAVSDLLLMFGKNEAVDYNRFKTISNSDLEKEIKIIVEKNKGKPFGALMGIVMSTFKGKVDGKLVSELLKKYS